LSIYLILRWKDDLPAPWWLCFDFPWVPFLVHPNPMTDPWCCYIW
jgi:hypothetical protein